MRSATRPTVRSSSGAVASGDASNPVHKTARYAQILRELWAGLSEWAVHPAFDTPELLAIELEANHIRQTDFDFLTSQTAKDIIKAEGIILIDYRALQAVWREK